VAYLHSCISLNRQAIKFPCTSILLDRILPDTELATSLTMKLGNNYIPVIGVNDFPEATYPAMLDGLNRARMEYRWVSRYICTDKEEGKKEAQKKEKAHRGNKKTFLQVFSESTSGETTRALNHGEGVKEEDSITAGIEIETDEAALGYFTSNVMVWDADFEKAKRKADAVIMIINSAGFTCKEETFNALEAWKSMLPGNIYANFRALPVMTTTLSHVVPLSSVWAGMRENGFAGKVSGVSIPHLVCSTAEGTPFYFSLNIDDVGHTCVFGPTGAGKSTLLNLLELQFLKYPDSRVIVFDKGRSCRQPCLASGGLFFEPAGENLDSQAAVNFQPLRDLETETDILNACDFIETLIEVNNYKITPPLRTAVREGIELLAGKPVEARTITSFLQYAKYMDPETKRHVFNEYLADYVWDGGKYGKIFDAAWTGISTDTRYLAIEMEGLMSRGEGCVVPALFYLFKLVEKKFEVGGNLTLLVLDEAWLFLRTEIFAAKLLEWFKELRKYNVSVVFATQDVADVERSPLKTTIIQQCFTKIYLADPSAVTAGMADVYSSFGLTDTEISLIAGGVMKRDYFYTSPAGRRMFRLDLGPVTLGLIGGADHERLDELTSSYSDRAHLCRDILDAKRLSYGGLIGPDAPPEPEKAARPERPKFERRKEDRLKSMAPAPEPKAEPAAETDAAAPVAGEPSAGRIIREVRSLGDRKGKRNGKGKGKAAESLAKKLGVSVATVYRARMMVNKAVEDEEARDVLSALERDELSVSAAYKKLFSTHKKGAGRRKENVDRSA
jgi:type IV secretion system protein VirB4